MHYIFKDLQIKLLRSFSKLNSIVSFTWIEFNLSTRLVQTSLRLPLSCYASLCFPCWYILSVLGNISPACPVYKPLLQPLFTQNHIDTQTNTKTHFQTEIHNIYLQNLPLSSFLATKMLHLKFCNLPKQTVLYLRLETQFKQALCLLSKHTCFSAKSMITLQKLNHCKLYPLSYYPIHLNNHSYLSTIYHFY